jgi:hypothetical protein
MSILLINEIEADVSSGEMLNLSKKDQEKTIGGAQCTYASEKYDPGSVVSMPGGAKTCNTDNSGNTWWH